VQTLQWAWVLHLLLLLLVLAGRSLWGQLHQLQSKTLSSWSCHMVLLAWVVS
jgi:hypothetical protein